MQFSQNTDAPTDEHEIHAKVWLQSLLFILAYTMVEISECSKVIQ